MLQLWTSVVLWMCGHAELLTSMERFPLLHGLSQDLTQEFPEEAIDTIDQALTQALQSAAAQESVSMQDMVCIRDYSTACPQEWSDFGDGETCLAPANYQGPCPATHTFGKAPAEKGQRALACESEFPCVGGSPQDYSMPCPSSWIEDLDHSCVAPGDYAGHCSGHKSFIGYTSSEKKEWGRRCGVTWPSRATFEESRKAARKSDETSCRIDYSFPCPRGWQLHGPSCTASSHEGRCGFEVRATLSTPQKMAFADACAVAWPCKI